MAGRQTSFQARRQRQHRNLLHVESRLPGTQVLCVQCVAGKQQYHARLRLRAYLGTSAKPEFCSKDWVRLPGSTRRWLSAAATGLPTERWAILATAVRWEPTILSCTPRHSTVLTPNTRCWFPAPPRQLPWKTASPSSTYGDPTVNSRHRIEFVRTAVQLSDALRSNRKSHGPGPIHESRFHSDWVCRDDGPPSGQSGIQQFSVLRFCRLAPTLRTSSRSPALHGMQPTKRQMPQAAITHCKQRMNIKLSYGLTLLSNYTWSKCMTDQHTQAGQNQQYRAEWLPGFGIAKDNAVCDTDATSVFHLSGSWQIPVGRGRTFLSDANRAVDAFLGGWAVNFIYGFQTGQPFTINCPVTTAAGLGCFANVVPGQGLYAGPHNHTQWLNPNAFAQPALATTIGQTDYSVLGGGGQQARGPSFSNLDSSVFKYFNFTETVRLQFRAEFFNTFNHPQFGQPATGNLNFTTLRQWLQFNYARRGITPG